jgi:hypothetical protein
MLVTLEQTESTQSTIVDVFFRLVVQLSELAVLFQRARPPLGDSLLAITSRRASHSLER